VLSERLSRLERADLVAHPDQGPGRAGEYVLTEAGRELELQRWFIGRRTLPDALARGAITIAGPSTIDDEFPRWFGPATPWHDTSPSEPAADSASCLRWYGIRTSRASRRSPTM
jgi:hypothetical protein